MKRVLMLAAVCAAVSSAFAATTTTWTGNGADNRWNNAANWSAGVPDAEATVTAFFPEGDWTIELDGGADCTISYYQVVLNEGAGKVTLTGSAALSYGSKGGSGRKIEILAGRELVIDGPTVSPWSYNQEGKVTIQSCCLKGAGKGHHLPDGAEMVVVGGTFDCTGNFSMTNGASRVTMTGGEMKLSYVSGSSATIIGADSSFRILGGDLTVRPSKFTVEERADFAIVGGTIHLTEAIASADATMWLSQRWQTLDALSASAAAVHLHATNANTYAFGGSLVVTNGGSVTFTMNNQDSSLWHCLMTGRGDLTTDAFRLYPAKSGGTLTVDLSSLTLGAGGFVSTDKSHNGYFAFVNGVSLGAFGDWAQTATESDPLGFSFKGPLAFDTLDPFDCETRHTVCLTNVNLAGTTSLRATGGGTVRLGLKNGGMPNILNELAVSGGTSLDFSRSSARVSANTIKVASGSSLTLAADMNSVLDAVVSSELADGSVKLAFEDAAFSAARAPVYFAPLGTDPDLTAFDTTDVPSGLSLAKRANAVYLTDGSQDVNDTTGASASGKVYYWTGAKNDDFSDAENWEPKVAVTSNTSGSRWFNGWFNTSVTNNLGANARPNKVVIGPDCGPFSFAGTMRPSDKGDTIVSYSSYPAVFTSQIGHKSDVLGFSVNSYGKGYVALIEGTPQSGSIANTNEFSFAGDVRLGKSWRFLEVTVTRTEIAALDPCLTLLPGASFVVDGAGVRSSSFASPVSFDVRSGATFEVVDCPNFTFEAEANTHIVDGTWTVSCPFLPKSLQAFRGAGMVNLPQVGADGVTLAGVEIADSVTLVPGDWTQAFPVLFRDTPTVKTAARTTIGEAVSFELESHATLTVDTAGGDLVMETPILGGGDVVKTGANALVLNCAGNVVDTLTVSGGTVKPGPALVAEADAGYVPFLTVKRLVGELTIENAHVRPTANADGTTTYSFKNKHGLLLLVR